MRKSDRQFFCFFGSKSNFKHFGTFFFGSSYPIFFSHESSYWVEIRLHNEFGWVWLCRSWEKVMDGFVIVVSMIFVLHRKIRPSQLFVHLSWVVATRCSTKKCIFSTEMSSKIKINFSHKNHNSVTKCSRLSTIWWTRTQIFTHTGPKQQGLRLGHADATK